MPTPVLGSCAANTIVVDTANADPLCTPRVQPAALLDKNSFLCGHCGDSLNFRPMTLADVPLVNSLLQSSPSATCDYTCGGIFMWSDMFNYQYDVVDNTLFIKGVCETNPDITAFMLPLGTMDMARALAMVDRWCHSRGLETVFSAVPADRLPALTALTPCITEEMSGWADYIYDIGAIASLSGKKYNKKRNHVNKFSTLYPSHVLEAITADNIPEVLEFLEKHPPVNTTGVYNTAEYEHRQCRLVLENHNVYPFIGAVLRTAPKAPIVAFTVAEIVGDTLFVHIEKMDHTVEGAGETIAHLFAARMLLEHPQLQLVNREEDCGDPGLRRAKESWHPCATLTKYNAYL